jgi:hypothetical protein
MSIAVLVLWALTASAGLRLLFTSGLGRTKQASAQTSQPVPVPATAGAVSHAEHAEHAVHVEPAEQIVVPSKRQIRRAERARFDTPELVRSRKESVGSLREVVEFTHPACAIVGLAFWMGYTLVHNRGLAWIAFGLAAVTACAGLAWFLSNRKNNLFSARLIAIHGGGAALTFVLAALTALTARG